MINRGQGGKIIVISSSAGKRGRARFAAYCASKFALVGFTQSLAMDLAPFKINVNAICPGGVDTERTDYINRALVPEGESLEEFRAQRSLEAAQNNPLGRVALGADIARMAAFLSSSEADYITGLSVSVSGGSVMD
jgi:NAD(P)-dependent dehydrogenase (short-subunit alcohol dehydrogenase family)